MSLKGRRASLSVFFSLPLFLTTVLAIAEVRLEVEPGFHGVFKLGQPFPVTVTLTNLGGPMEGVLDVKVWKGGPSKVVAPYPFHYKREVSLARQSQRRVQFTVDPDSMARPLNVSFSSTTGKVSREVSLRGHFSPSPLILLLTGNSGLLSIPIAVDSPVPVVSISVDELPSDARAYQGVWAVVFYEQSLRDLSSSQKSALESWLSSGGRILFLGGLHYALYQEPSAEVFLPVRVLGVKRMTALPSLERYYGKSLSTIGPILVQESEVVGGRVLVEEENIPILVESARGRGKVMYLSLDVGRPPLSQWDGLSRIFSDLLGVAPERRPGLWTSWDPTVFSILLSDSTFFSTRVPLVPFLVSLLLYLGVLLLLVRLWCKQTFSRLILSASFLLLVFLFTVGGYLFFDRGSQIIDGVLFSSTLLDGQPDGYAEVQSNVGLFSTRRKHYSFQMQRGWNHLELVQPRLAKSNSSPVEIEDGVRSTSVKFPSKEWDFKLFRIRSVRPFPFRIDATRQENEIYLELANLSPRDLSECWLIYYGKGYRLGDIPLGSSLVRQFALSPDGKQLDGPGEKLNMREIPFDDGVRGALFRNSIFPQDQVLARWGENSAFIIGWVERDSRRVWVNDRRVLSHSYTLFRAPIPLQVEEEEDL
jgi:hypothetical protein